MKVTILLLFMSISLLINAQNAVLTGKITDKKTKEALFGINIVLDDKTGGTTNEKGIYQISISPGKHIVNFFYVGYKNESRNIFINQGETIELNIAIESETQLISEIVVSASRHEQKVSEVIVSMEVIRPEMIENKNITSLDESINKVPGVDVMDDQPTIRGGSGYSYGAGSRVMIMVDDMPMLSADAGDPKWNFLPLENVSQIEILKGASSVLYGSSALNGVINLRTAYPTDIPKTKISIYNGFYMNPDRLELKWWGANQPLFAGTNIFHSRQIKNVDLVVGAHAFSTDGYRENETEARARMNVNLNVRSKKIQGLTYGVNSNIMGVDKSDFFIWVNADSGAYRQDTGSIARTKGMRFNVDPHIMYFDKKDNRHTLNTRYLYFNNRLPDDTAKDSESSLKFADYQYQKTFKKSHVLTVGMTSSYGNVKSNLFGDHYSTNVAIYSQMDFKLIKKLNFSAGVRGEYFKIDKEETQSVINGDTIKEIPIQPVFRVGANYELAKYTFLRMSYGQGYRFPSIAEKYVSTSLSLLNIFPNPDLKAETGWSSEIGLKQGFKVSGWNGYIDAAFFWQEYREMMEFTFGLYNPETFKAIDTANVADMEALGKYGLGCIGFQSVNVGRAKITGIDFTVTGIGKIFNIPATLLAGYTFLQPIDLNNDTTKTNKDRYLKYRFLHSAKVDLELKYKKWSWGVSSLYRSHMINIDSSFEEPLLDGSTIYILPGLKDYRAKHNKGYVIFDFRVGYSVTPYSTMSLTVNNAFNKEYMGRPGDIGAPRNVSLQYSLNF